MKIRMTLTVEYEVEVDHNVYGPDVAHLVDQATNELEHTGSADLARAETGVRRWRCSGMGVKP